MSIISMIKGLLAPVVNRAYKIRDKIVIPSYGEKRSIIRGYVSKYNLKVLVETGAFLGDTIDYFKNDFEKLITFELSESLATKVKERFKGISNIDVIAGDSGKLMGGVLSDISVPCIFWLDGHYSSEFLMGDEYIITAKGEKETPILEELNAILKHPVKSHVILIDDARCFNGKNDYPSFSSLKKFVFGLTKDVEIERERDIIRIVPKQR